MSLPYTIDDHFVFGYNNIPFAEKQNFDTDKFFCTYSRCRRNPGTFKEECINTAKEVSKQATSLGRVPYVFLSGGLDSEVVARAFVDAEVPFKAISFRFMQNLSGHEVYYIDKFVKKHNIDHTYYDIDPDWLISAEADQYAKQSQVSQSEMLPHMKLLVHVWNTLKGFPVLGNGDLYVSKDISVEWIFDKTKPKYKWNYIEYEYILAWYRFAVYNNILGSIGFFMHNPEIVLAMIQDTDMNDCINDRIPYKMSSRSTKTVVYIKSWNDLEIRSKFHGSEQLGGRCMELNRKYSAIYRTTDVVEIQVNEFEKMLEPINQVSD